MLFLLLMIVQVTSVASLRALWAEAASADFWYCSMSCLILRKAHIRSKGAAALEPIGMRVSGNLAVRNSGSSYALDCANQT